MKEGKRYKIGLDLLDTRLLWTAFCVRYEFRVTVYSVSNALAACKLTYQYFHVKGSSRQADAQRISAALTIKSKDAPAVSFFQGAMPRQVLKPCPMKGNERQEVSHEASIFGQTLRLGENNHNR
ncbi:unnamed protein product [Fusarium fujikuroi]|nr:unnamed protein product [Fusarium fujikuroi]